MNYSKTTLLNVIPCCSSLAILSRKHQKAAQKCGLVCVCVCIYTYISVTNDCGNSDTMFHNLWIHNGFSHWLQLVWYNWVFPAYTCVTSFQFPHYIKLNQIRNVLQITCVKQISGDINLKDRCELRNVQLSAEASESSRLVWGCLVIIHCSFQVQGLQCRFEMLQYEQLKSKRQSCQE